MLDLGVLVPFSFQLSPFLPPLVFHIHIFFCLVHFLNLLDNLFKLHHSHCHKIWNKSKKSKQIVSFRVGRSKYFTLRLPRKWIFLELTQIYQLLPKSKQQQLLKGHMCAGQRLNNQLLISELYRFSLFKSFNFKLW